MLNNEKFNIDQENKYQLCNEANIECIEYMQNKYFLM